MKPEPFLEVGLDLRSFRVFIPKRLMLDIDSRSASAVIAAAVVVVGGCGGGGVAVVVVAAVSCGSAKVQDGCDGSETHQATTLVLSRLRSVVLSAAAVRLLSWWWCGCGSVGAAMWCGGGRWSAGPFRRLEPFPKASHEYR